MNAEFQVILPVDHHAPDVLGVWQVLAGGISFDAMAGSGEAALSWRVNLPADPGDAAAALAQHDQLLELASQAIPDASQRLVQFLETCPRPDDVSFAVDRLSLAQPEQALALLLQQEMGPVDFSGQRGVSGRVRELAEEARRFVQQVEDMLRRFAQIETSQDHVLLARTSFQWSGDAFTVSHAALRPDQIALHRRAVGAVLRTRMGWIRLAVHFAQSALMLGAGLLSGNPLLAAGGVWKFFKDVLAEWRQLHASAPIMLPA